jgi:hypothetical protein
MVTVSSKIITTYAGNGIFTTESPGDGGPATSASIYPQSIFMDTSGNLYCTENYGFRTRKIAAGSTIITNFAGSGYVSSVTGMGGLATSAGIPGSDPYVAGDNQGNIFIGSANRIFRVDGSTNFITLYAGNICVFYRLTPLLFVVFVRYQYSRLH